MDKIIQEDEDWIRNPRAPKPEGVGELGFTYDTRRTWDCPIDSNEFEIIAEHGFQATLNRHNVFGTCEHKVVTIQCYCNRLDMILQCSKCYSIFCCDECYKKCGETESYKTNNEKKRDSVQAGTVNQSHPKTVRTGNTVHQDQENVKFFLGKKQLAKNEGGYRRQEGQVSQPHRPEQQMAYQQKTSFDSNRRWNGKGNYDNEKRGGNFQHRNRNTMKDAGRQELGFRRTQEQQAITAVAQKTNRMAGSGAKDNLPPDSSPTSKNQSQVSQDFVDSFEEAVPVPVVSKIKGNEVILNEPLQVVITNVDNPWAISFCLYADMNLWKTFGSFSFDPTWLELSEVRVGTVGLAPFGDEDKWYRSKVMHDGGGDHVEVYFLDYGNTFVVEKKRLRQMSEELVRIPPLSHTMALSNILPMWGKEVWNNEQVRAIQSIILDKPCTVFLFVPDAGKENFWYGTISYKGSDVAETLIARNLAQHDIHSTLSTKVSSSDSVTIGTSATVKSCIPSVDKTGSNESNAREQRTGMLAKYLVQSSKEGIPEDSAGASRSNVAKTSPTTVSPSGLKNIKEHPTSDCRSVVPRRQTTSDISKHLNESCTVKEVNKGFVVAPRRVPTFNRESFLPYRLPTDEERTIDHVLSEHDRTFKPGEVVENVIVTHVNSPNDFYVIRGEDLKTRYRIEDELSRQATFGLNPYHPLRDEITVTCAMKEMYKWARIKIEKIEDAKCHIRFIDYGNRDVIRASDIRSLPKWMLTIPQLAYNCSLGIIPCGFSENSVDPSIGQWQQSVCEHLIKLGKFETAAERTSCEGLELRCLLLEESHSVSYVDLLILPRGLSWSRSLVNGQVAKWMDGVLEALVCNPYDTSREPEKGTAKLQGQPKSFSHSS